MEDKENKNVKYDKKKWKKIMTITQDNYANIIKRLERKSKISNIILIYYSIFLIMCTLTTKYFPKRFNCTLSEYFSLLLSVIVLAYSLVNNNANYAIRIKNVEKSLNKMKDMKRKLEEKSNEELKEMINQYNELTDATERREDVDFFRTIKNLCKKEGISYIRRTKKCFNSNKRYVYNKDLVEICADIYENEEKALSEENQKIIEINDYLCEINVWYQSLLIILEYGMYLFLFVTPIVLFFYCLFT